MIRRLELQPAHAEIVRRFLAAHVPEAEVWAYGSRVNGSAHDGSDLDLALRPPDDQPLAAEKIFALRDALAESELPILVDLLDWTRLPERFRREIEREHVILQTPVPVQTAESSR